MIGRICLVLVLHIPLCFSQTQSPFGKPVQVYFKSEIPHFGYAYGGITAYIREDSDSNYVMFEKFQLYKTFPQQLTYFFNAISEDFTVQQNSSCTGALQQACSVNITHTDPGDVDFQLVIDSKCKMQAIKIDSVDNFYHITMITVTNTHISRTNDKCQRATPARFTSSCICDDGIFDNNCDTMPTNCSEIDVEPRKDLSSKYLQFQLKLSESYQNHTVDQYVYVFDDTSNEFYSISYGPVEDTVLMKPLQPHVFQIKVFFAKMPNFDHDKTNFLNKNFKIDKAAIFHNAFCTLTSDAILDCSCCEDYKRSSWEVAPQCKDKVLEI
ncbi:hypothetical protein M3Y96_00388500 [Aphelenchoides besseyi]|nr:hypothetical protein M3Y96_00388500 [Aphelenchoides besseyi]